MNNRRWFSLWLFLLVACSKPQSTEQSSKATASAGDIPASGQPQTAVFSAPGIDDELVKKFAEVLADKEGLISAQADKEKALFVVTFNPGKIGRQEILGLLQKVKPQVDFQKLEHSAPPVPNEGGKCGRCPYQNTCEKKQ